MATKKTREAHKKKTVPTGRRADAVIYFIFDHGGNLKIVGDEYRLRTREIYSRLPSFLIA